jgi:hypothetical protein
MTRSLAVLLCFMLSGVIQPMLAQQSTPSQQEPASQPSTVPPVELPESPGASKSPSNAPAPAANPQSGNAQQSQQAAQPSGTAAAPAVQVSGGAASKPAGVAIAPPKQRQVRSWLIRFGFLAGAGAAIGTVAALSAASPSRVPNSGH